MEATLNHPQAVAVEGATKMSAKIMIQGHQIVKAFDVGEEQLTILKNIDLKVPRGQFVAIMGPSGSGKSTLLYLLGGLDYATSGVIRVAGQNINEMNNKMLAMFRSEKIGFVFQSFHLVPTLNAMENVGLPGVFLGIPQHIRDQRAMSLLRSLGMGERADHRPSQLSGGQQQRVAIARALFNQPPIIMGDEPTGALDSKTGHTVLKLLQTLSSKHGKTVLMVTHDPGVAEYADRMVHLKDGIIVDDYLTSERKTPNEHIA